MLQRINHTTTLKVKYTQSDRQKLAEAAKLEKQAEELRKQVKDSILRDEAAEPTIRAVEAITGGTVTGSAVELSAWEAAITLSITSMQEQAAPAPAPKARPPQPHFHGLHPSTVNMLLNGKLLSNAEKRRMLRAATQGVLDDQADEGGEA